MSGKCRKTRSTSSYRYAVKVKNRIPLDDQLPDSRTTTNRGIRDRHLSSKPIAFTIQCDSRPLYRGLPLVDADLCPLWALHGTAQERDHWSRRRRRDSTGMRRRASSRWGGSRKVGPTPASDLARSENSESDMGTFSTSSVADSNSNWAVCGKSSGLISMPTSALATHRVQIEVMPLFAGHLPFPNIKMFKYLPHTSPAVIQPDPDSCVENDTLSLLDKTLDDQGDTASIHSRGSIHSLGSGESQQRGLPMPRLEPFSPGQVFNHSHARQVLVLPATDNHIMEVNIT